MDPISARPRSAGGPREGAPSATPFGVAGADAHDRPKPGQPAALCPRYCEPLPAAVEFRDSSWLEPGQRERTWEMLRAHNAAYVCADMPQQAPAAVPPVLAITADKVVNRLHCHSPGWERGGKEERYRYEYSDPELAAWAERSAPGCLGLSAVGGESVYVQQAYDRRRRGARPVPVPFAPVPVVLVVSAIGCLPSARQWQAPLSFHTAHEVDAFGTAPAEYQVAV
ncbi:DUF72 domain-containing protein [Catenulispora yoronensis]